MSKQLHQALEAAQWAVVNEMMAAIREKPGLVVSERDWTKLEELLYQHVMVTWTVT